MTVDGGADTCLVGKGHIMLEITERKANVIGFDDGLTRSNLPIGTAATVVTTEAGEDVILILNEAIDHTSQDHSMLSVNQVRAHGLGIDDSLNIIGKVVDLEDNPWCLVLMIMIVISSFLSTIRII